MERFLQTAERVIALIRPKFYNRIAWVVVLAGLLLVASPWWLDLVSALAHRYFDVTLPTAASHVAMGVVLVGLGLLYHLIVHYINELIASQRESTTLAAQREHDREIFAQFVSHVSENDLAWILGDLQDQHAYTSPQGTKLDLAVKHLLAPSTQFIDVQVSAAGKRLGMALRELRNWTSLNFFVYGPQTDEGLRFCLYPELNQDRTLRVPSAEDSRRYGEFAQELYVKVDEVHAQYAQFRAVVKNVLAV